MAASPGPGTVIRWLLLLCLLTAATVGVVGVGFETAGRSFGAAASYWVAVFSFALWAVPSAWLVQSRYAGLPADSTDRLRGLHVPAVAPRRSGEEAEEAWLDPAACPGAELRIEVAADPVPAADVCLPDPLLEPQSFAADVREIKGDASPAVAAADQPPAVTSADHSADDGLASAVPAASAPVEDAGRTAGGVEAGRVRGAEELAELLNLYDRVGLAPEGGSDAEAVVPYRVDAGSGGRTLWGELVEDFGAATIDFRGDEAGECWITLSTGDLVFYAPERQRWMWVVFESDQNVSPSVVEAPPIARSVADQA